MLHVQQVTASDVGVYACSAANGVQAAIVSEFRIAIRSQYLSLFSRPPVDLPAENSNITKVPDEALPVDLSCHFPVRLSNSPLGDESSRSLSDPFAFDSVCE